MLSYLYILLAQSVQIWAKGRMAEVRFFPRARCFLFSTAWVSFPGSFADRATRGAGHSRISSAEVKDDRATYLLSDVFTV
jgi:hypothetical protein